jgi:hypothetical protein
MIGLCSAVIFLLVLGPDIFILPSLCFTVLVLALLKGRFKETPEEAVR